MSRLRLPCSYKQLVFQFLKSDLLVRLPNCELLTAGKVGNPGLTGMMIAKAMGMSVRRLSDIFSREGTGIAALSRDPRFCVEPTWQRLPPMA